MEQKLQFQAKQMAAKVKIEIWYDFTTVYSNISNSGYILYQKY